MRLVIVLALLTIVGGLWVIRRWRLGAAQRLDSGERLPPELVDSSGQRTWVLVTAPMCASCGPLEERLRELDPEGRLVVVDAAERPDLARTLRARSAPTVLVASPSGVVRRRLVGPALVGARLDASLVSSVVG